MTGVLVAAAGRPWERDALRAVEASHRAKRCMDVADLLALAVTSDARVAVVSLKLAGLDADSVYRLSKLGVATLAVVEAGETATDASALGIDHTLEVTELGGLYDALRTLRPTPGDVPQDVMAPTRGRGHLSVVWGPAGSPGRSTVALNLAVEKAHGGSDTLLLDADPYGGSIAQMLAILDEVSGLLGATRAANSGRTSLMAEFAREIAPRLAILTGLPRAELWSQLRPGPMSLLIDETRRRADHVIVDVGFSLEVPDSFDSAAPHRNQTTLQMLEAADQVIAVGLPDPLGIARLARGLHDLHEAVPGADVSVVVNRQRGSLGWSQQEVSDSLKQLTGLVPVAYLPHDLAAVDRAMITGRSLRESAPDSALRKTLTALAAVIR